MTGTRNRKPGEDAGLLPDVKKLVEQMFTSKEFLEQISKTVTNVISSTVDAQFRKLEEENAELKRRIGRLESALDTQQKEVRRIEQHTRQNSLCIFGVPDTRGDSTKGKIVELLKKKFVINVQDSDISACYRLGQYKEDKVRPVLVHFANITLRNEVFKRKSILKGAGVVIRENLSPSKLRLLKETVQKYGTGNVWTVQGEIYVKQRDRIKRLREEEDMKND